ncbi:class I SAM-dependent methyltransferase [Paraglaciecola hydrolytica]|uniref:Methyltransferase n=1 Tax=Paraglaciecola hydrolytica TaxID=1799789 RepID=A0A135ZZ42_9ALTE|nr:class I SAM-dependent methyltransferase [Paraglaciecola hydrolytica]KXI28255.1 methyltransferase [Paraglaciecola hydrolytica]
MKRLVKFAVLASLVTCSPVFADTLQDAIQSDSRTTAERSRDEYRHPQQTLRFFDVQPNMAVAEIAPGGGWYSNILAPLLKEKGQYYAAHNYVDDKSSDYYRKGLAAFKEKVASDANFSNTKVTAFHPTKALDFAPAGSLDRVLTFRNVHNWYMGDGQTGIDNAFASFFKALKPGGVLGVVEHSLPESFDDEFQKKSGYMKKSFVVAAAEKAGFILIASSDVNANPLDSSDHEKGVWTLPPSLRLGEQDRARYLAIGESNRMTLKFIKPTTK